MKWFFAFFRRQKKDLQQCLVLGKCEALCSDRQGWESLRELGALFPFGFVYRQSWKSTPICNEDRSFSVCVLAWCGLWLRVPATAKGACAIGEFSWGLCLESSWLKISLGTLSLSADLVKQKLNCLGILGGGRGQWNIEEGCCLQLLDGWESRHVNRAAHLHARSSRDCCLVWMGVHPAAQQMFTGEVHIWCLGWQWAMRQTAEFDSTFFFLLLIIFCLP